LLGEADGSGVGALEGEADGSKSQSNASQPERSSLTIGDLLGSGVGRFVGSDVGFLEGEIDGELVGSLVGDFDGSKVEGDADGPFEGEKDGEEDGDFVGAVVGGNVGEITSGQVSRAVSPVVSSGSNGLIPPGPLAPALAASSLSSRMTVGTPGPGAAAPVDAEVSKVSLSFGKPTANPMMSRSAAVPPATHRMGLFPSRVVGLGEAGDAAALVLPATAAPVSTSPKEKFSRKVSAAVSVVASGSICFASDMMKRL